MNKEFKPLKKHLKPGDIDGGTYPQFVEKLRKARVAEIETVVITEDAHPMKSDLKPSVKRA